MSAKPIWWKASPSDRVAVDLPDEQRTLLIYGLTQWGGPTRATDALARAMGFSDRDAIYSEGRRIRTALQEQRSLTKRDWARALVATEIVFASSFFGAAGDWEAVTPWTDERTLSVLRGLQRNLAGLRSPPRSAADGREDDPLAFVD